MFLFLFFWFPIRSFCRTEHNNQKQQSGHVYKSLLRGCLKRPQRNSQNLPANCIDCEETRKYIKNSIELYRHFSNPALNRRWICRACDTDNNSVTWHCVICDTVSYLAPIYKETLCTRRHEATAGTAAAASATAAGTAITAGAQLELNSSSSSAIGPNSSGSAVGAEQQTSEESLPHHSQLDAQSDEQHSNRRHLKSRRFAYFRRTQSLSNSIDKSPALTQAAIASSSSSFAAASARSCHICYVSNLGKDIFNLPYAASISYQQQQQQLLPHKSSKFWPSYAQL